MATTITDTGKAAGRVLDADHGITDSKGRAVGGYATINEGQSPGIWYVRTYATRNGAQYGAAFPRPTVITGDRAAAMDHATRKLLAQGARYRKATP